MHDWSTSFAGSIQKGMIGTSDPYFALEFIYDVVQNIKQEDAGLLDSVSSALRFAVMASTIQLLSIMSFFVTAWATWGYALAKLVGWMLVPLLLLPATAQWFNKWVGFFVGFLFYEILGRANIAMVLMLITSFFNLSLTVRPSRPIILNGDALSDFTGLLAMLFVSILALASTGKFAVAFGGAVDGMGTLNGAVKKTAKFAAGRIMK